MNKKLLIIGGLFVAIGGITYWLFRKTPQPPVQELELLANADGDINNWWSSYPGEHYNHIVAIGNWTEDMLEENYQIESTSQTGTILRIEVTTGKAQAGGYMDNYMRVLLRINNQSYYGNWQLVDLYSAKSYSQVWIKNPATGSNWTWEDINNLQIGMQGDKGAASDASIECYNDDYRSRLTVIYEE